VVVIEKGASGSLRCGRVVVIEKGASGSLRCGLARSSVDEQGEGEGEGESTGTSGELSASAH
jgi:hypothetical protein